MVTRVLFVTGYILLADHRWSILFSLSKSRKLVVLGTLRNIKPAINFDDVPPRVGKTHVKLRTPVSLPGRASRIIMCNAGDASATPVHHSKPNFRVAPRRRHIIHQ